MNLAIALTGRLPSIEFNEDCTQCLTCQKYGACHEWVEAKVSACFPQWKHNRRQELIDWLTSKVVDGTVYHGYTDYQVLQLFEEEIAHLYQPSIRKEKSC